MYIFLIKILILLIGIWMGWDLHKWFFRKEIKKDSICSALWNTLLHRLCNIYEGKEKVKNVECRLAVIVKRDIEITKEVLDDLCCVLPDVKEYIAGNILLCELLCRAVEEKVVNDAVLDDFIYFLKNVLSNSSNVKYILEHVDNQEKENKNETF